MVLVECMHVCVCLRLLSAHCPTSCVSDYYTTTISGLSLSLNPSIHLSRCLVKGSVPNKAHSHAVRMWGSTVVPTHTTITYSLSLTVSSTLLYPLSQRFSALNILALFFYSLHNVSLSSSIYVSLSHTIYLSLVVAN